MFFLPLDLGILEWNKSATEAEKLRSDSLQVKSKSKDSIESPFLF